MENKGLIITVEKEKLGEGIERKEGEWKGKEEKDRRREEKEG